MNLALFYDLETTGLPLFSEPSEDPRQPHIVQAAAMLVDIDSRAVVQSIDVIVQPDGWTIPDDVAALHGITTEHALAVGIPEEFVVCMLLELWSGRTRIAHNETFDARIMRIALKRFIDSAPGQSPAGSQPISDDWKAGAAECTARIARPICALPKNKTPTLTEAYRHFFGAEFDGAHRAMPDARACMAVYFAIKDMANESAQVPA